MYILVSYFPLHSVAIYNTRRRDIDSKVREEGETEGRPLTARCLGDGYQGNRAAAKGCMVVCVHSHCMG